MHRSLLQQAAERALRQPQHAPSVAREVLGILDQMGTLQPPAGYVYAGAHRFVARTRDLAVEDLPEDSPPGPQLWTTLNEPVRIKLPFDTLIQGVSGYAVVRTEDDTQQLLNVGLSNARDGRDLVTVDWDVDGQTSFSTDGHGRRMYPMSVTVGTARHPRPMAWTVRRNQTVNVRFRNIINAIAPPAVWTGFETTIPVIAEAAVTFHCLNLETP